jgi:hypothetical protein
MAHYFRNAIAQQSIGSRSVLDSERAKFKNFRTSGCFEIQSMPNEFEILVYANGEESGAYRLWANSRLKITPAEIGIGWDKQAVPIRSVALPDQASRAIWQALEYQRFSQSQVNGISEWRGFLETCRRAGLSAIVEVASEDCDGFVFLHEGFLATNESIFCSQEGFTNDLDTVEPCLEGRLQLTIYEADPATEAYQCTLLRMGEVRWGSRILNNYKDMVGQKLLHLLNVNLNNLLSHQQSNIRLSGTDIIDNHFFSESWAAANVYRTLFMDMSQLIGRMIGGMVTRRIMSNTFDQLGFGEREIMETHTLTPATLLR